MYRNNKLYFLWSVLRAYLNANDSPRRGQPVLTVALCSDLPDWELRESRQDKPLAVVQRAPAAYNPGHGGSNFIDRCERRTALSLGWRQRSNDAVSR
jgi:hypothetical protein